MSRGDPAFGRFLRSFAERGLLEFETEERIAERTVGDGKDGRIAYDPSDEGRRKVQRIWDQLAGETVAVATDADVERYPIEELTERLKVGSVSAALARQGTNGVVRIGETEVDRFVNRTDEPATVKDLLSAVKDGLPWTVLIGGAEGIGKTTLVEEAAEAARAGGSRSTLGPVEWTQTFPTRWSKKR